MTAPSQPLSQAPVSLLIIMTLAIGIGPNVAIFSVLKALILEPLPYPDPNRLVQVWETPVGGRGTQPFAYQNFVDIREQSECFENFGLQHPRSFNLGGAVPEASAPFLDSE
jgi:putative ABC transport system permease protein